MRLRKKPWARPALEACSFFVINPTEYKGNGAKYSAIPTRYGWNLGAVKEASYQSLLLPIPIKILLPLILKMKCWPSQ